MSTQMCRLVATLAMRSVTGHSPSSKYCVHQAVTAATGPSGTLSSANQMSQRRAYSLDSLSSGPGRPGERISPSSALTHRNLSAVAVQSQCQPLCRYDFLDVVDVEENIRRVKACRSNNHYIVDPALAKVVVEHLGPDLDDSKTVIFECNPGPGVLTRTLLNAGAQRLVALEGNKLFLHDLQKLESGLDGQLEVVHCDYFKLDPMGAGIVNPPAMFTDKLFTDLGISEANWTDDVPVKVFGILPQHNARGALLKMMYSLFERLSVFRYGRVELNLFISEMEYIKLMSHPGDMIRYRSFSVLWQMACDIKLLHKEPWDSFVSSKKHSIKKGMLPNDHMCLVRLRPRIDLFSENLTPSNSHILLMMVKQCMVKRKYKLINFLNLCSPDSGSKLLAEMHMPEDILTGNTFPEQYLKLFELMEKSQEFTQSWLYSEILENTKREGWA